MFLGRGAEKIAEELERLNEANIRISLDDFGTGFASLTHLLKFPIQCIKIDRSFTRDLHADPAARAIVRGVIGMGHGLRLQVVAEGVETEQQLTRLLGKGCDVGQGYLFGKPMPAASVPAFVGKWTRLLEGEPERQPVASFG